VSKESLMLYNIKFWEPYIKRKFIGQIHLFYKTMKNRLIATFNTIDEESEKLSNEKWEELSNNAYSPDIDPADLAEAARDEGIDYYFMLSGIKQTLLNVSATGMYHLFEQQVLFFLRREILHPTEENNKKLMKINVFKERLLRQNIDIELFPSWETITELKWLSNSIKHAEGYSANKLRQLRPNLFSPPAIRENGMDLFGGKPASNIYMPLSGEDLYVSEKDLEKYKNAISNFWSEFIEKCNHHDKG
jgi:hypothetical protein